ETLNEFPDLYEARWLEGMRRKLGLDTDETGDRELVQGLLDWMQAAKADFTNTFRDLTSETLLAGERYQHPDFRAWHTRWQERLRREGRPLAVVYERMNAVNPFVIPRNHRVEEVLKAAEERDDLTPLHELLAALELPFETTPERATYTVPPADESGYRTFCGT
ncbi:MAG: protein adenylyltransferase SelO family protein, partial [Gemmataceae bacterium]